MKTSTGRARADGEKILSHGSLCVGLLTSQFLSPYSTRARRVWRGIHRSLVRVRPFPPPPPPALTPVFVPWPDKVGAEPRPRSPRESGSTRTRRRIGDEIRGIHDLFRRRYAGTLTTPPSPGRALRADPFAQTGSPWRLCPAT